MMKKRMGSEIGMNKGKKTDFKLQKLATMQEF
jgi:hypothetical protein